MTNLRINRISVSALSLILELLSEFSMVWSVSIYIFLFIATLYLGKALEKNHGVKEVWLCRLQTYCIVARNGAMKTLKGWQQLRARAELCTLKEESIRLLSPWQPKTKLKDSLRPKNSRKTVLEFKILISSFVSSSNASSQKGKEFLFTGNVMRIARYHSDLLTGWFLWCRCLSGRTSR